MNGGETVAVFEALSREGLIYKELSCGCIYSAGNVDQYISYPSISYCCTCTECSDISEDDYYSIVNRLYDELIKTDKKELIASGSWIDSPSMKQYIRKYKKKNVEAMWERGQVIYDKYTIIKPTYPVQTNPNNTA